jgi:hypothetical protein
MRGAVEAGARWAGLVVLAAIPLVLGGVYSVHHTDSHHWGFVLGTALDFMAGRELFTEIFLQYGAGSPLLFRLLSFISIPITYTTIGYVVSLFYAAGLVLLFLCLEHLHSTTLAWGMTLLVVLFHPWPVYPWADYFAGTCLLLACYLLLRGEWWREAVAWGGAAAALFLAFLFRNTYLLSFLAAGVVYGGLALALPKLRDRRIIRMLALLGGLIALYLSFLAWQGKLGLAYLQTTGQSGDVYGLNEGRTWFLLRELLVPRELPFLLFSLLALLNVALILRLLWRRGEWLMEGGQPGLILWFALLGGAGFSQSLHLYELFRLQNACSPLFLGAVALLAGWMPWAESTRRLVLGYAWLPLLLFSAALRFPDLLVKPSPTMLWPVIERPYEAVRQMEAGGGQIPILAGHRFHPEVWRFYQEMADQLCDGKSRIVNLTFDPVLPYLCPGQVNVSSIPFHSPEHLRRLATPESMRILAGRFREGEVIVSQLTAQMRNHPELEQVATVVRPGRIRWMPVEPLGVFRRRTGAPLAEVP